MAHQILTNFTPMKASKLIRQILITGAFISGIAIQTFAQVVLPEITVTATRYKYLNAVSPEEAAQPVDLLEQYAAAYNIKDAASYEDEFDTYFVSFFIPDGKILAVYDKDGTLLRTAEKYKNVAVPAKITQAVATRFPNWSISRDVYLVTYQERGGHVSKKVYKLVLENGDMRMRIKINDQGEFL